MRYTHAECQVISLDMESKVVLGSILELGPDPSKDAIGRIKRLLRRLQPNRTAEEEALIEEFGLHWSFAGPTILPQPCGNQCTRPHHHYSELEAYIWKYFKDALIHDRMVASAKTHKIYKERLRQINKCTPEELRRFPHFGEALFRELNETSWDHGQMESWIDAKKAAMNSSEKMILSLSSREGNAIGNWESSVKRILDTQLPQGLVSRLCDLSLDSSPDPRTSQNMGSGNLGIRSLSISLTESPERIRQAIRRLRPSSTEEEELIQEYGENWWQSPALYVPELIGMQYESSRYDPYQKEVTARKYLKEARKQEKMLAAVRKQRTYVGKLWSMRQSLLARERRVPHIEEVVENEFSTENLKQYEMLGLVRAQQHGLKLFAGVAQCLYGE